jgi:hypothetical protein
MNALSDFDAAAQIVNAQPADADFFGPARAEDVQMAERLLGLTLPPSYRKFLETYGVGAFKDAGFYGIIAGKVPGSSVPSMGWRTLDDRKMAGYPKTHLTIMSSGYGPIYCLDASSVSADGEYPVISWTPSTDLANPGDRLADNFGSFFLNEINQRQ